LLDPLTQDSYAFFEDHAIFRDVSGVVLDISDRDRIADPLAGARR
jgi:hypothetical protein